MRTAALTARKKVPFPMRNDLALTTKRNITRMIWRKRINVSSKAARVEMITNTW